MHARFSRLVGAAWLSALVGVALTGCIADPYEGCFQETALHGPACESEVEAAIDTLRSSLDNGLASVHRNPMGEKLGEVVAVEGRTLSLDFGRGDVRTFTWLTDLPFAIAVGQEVRAETTAFATTLTFPSGSLWVHAMVGFYGPGQEVFEVGPLEVAHRDGCHSRLGTTVDPVVVASDGKTTRVLPGQQVEVDGWTFHNHGATETPGETDCNMVLEGRYLGIWTAESAHAGTLTTD